MKINKKRLETLFETLSEFAKVNAPYQYKEWLNEVREVSKFPTDEMYVTRLYGAIVKRFQASFVDTYNKLGLDKFGGEYPVNKLTSYLTAGINESRRGTLRKRLADDLFCLYSRDHYQKAVQNAEYVIVSIINEGKVPPLYEVYHNGFMVSSTASLNEYDISETLRSLGTNKDEVYDWLHTEDAPAITGLFRSHNQITIHLNDGSNLKLSVFDIQDLIAKRSS